MRGLQMPVQSDNSDHPKREGADDKKSIETINGYTYKGLMRGRAKSAWSLRKKLECFFCFGTGGIATISISSLVTRSFLYPSISSPLCLSSYHYISKSAGFVVSPSSTMVTFELVRGGGALVLVA